MERNIAILGLRGPSEVRIHRCFGTAAYAVGKLRLLASTRSAGTKLVFRGREITVEEVGPRSFGASTSLVQRRGAGQPDMGACCVAAGARVIDNSSAFRMDAGVAAGHPERSTRRPSVMPTHCQSELLYHHYDVPVGRCIECIPSGGSVVSTYQAASGAGRQAMLGVGAPGRATCWRKAGGAEDFSASIAFNLFSHNTAGSARTVTTSKSGTWSWRRGRFRGSRSRHSPRRASACPCCGPIVRRST